LGKLNERLAATADSLAGRESVFIGQIHAGEIYNNYPQECSIEGTRRWLPGRSRAAVEDELRQVLADVARRTRTTIDTDFRFIRDAFRLDNDPVVEAFQDAYAAVSGQRLPTGPKPFVDDGNSFYGLAHKAAITHGPKSGGQHTVQEWASIEDLVRVALLYALTATGYCEGNA
jgi:acetylornithine deacetylase/succinyl-diaminopimelate desuccinylase-like protein